MDRSPFSTLSISLAYLSCALILPFPFENPGRETGVEEGEAEKEDDVNSSTRKRTEQTQKEAANGVKLPHLSHPGSDTHERFFMGRRHEWPGQICLWLLE